RGEVVYAVYRALTHALSPLMRLHLRWRRFRGREHPLRWQERLGCPSARRPDGRLIWFHAVSLGEGLAAIPIIKRCLQSIPGLTVLMTTTTTSAFEVIKCRLPSCCIYQFSPLDIPSSIDNFLQYWRPDAVVLMESELWPNLIMGASRNGIVLALLNARVSADSFRRWSHPVTFPLITLLLSRFSLILPLSTTQGIRLQLLQAPPSVVNYCGDLKSVVDIDDTEDGSGLPDDIRSQLSRRKVWMASSIHEGEEQVFMNAHNVLQRKHPDMLSIIVARQPHHGRDVTQKLEEHGVRVALRSRGDCITSGNSIYVVDSLGELRNLYGLTPVAVIGGSFFPGLSGHNVSEAAAAGCAVLTGHFFESNHRPHVGHFSHVVAKMQRVEPLSVLQVRDEEQLVRAVDLLFDDPVVLKARRDAARRAYLALSEGVVEDVFEMLRWCV
ncbi:hypothetical protein M569_08668, partial [Genlisea aurea]